MELYNITVDDTKQQNNTTIEPSNASYLARELGQITQ